MAQLNAISATTNIKNRLLDFCRSDHYLTDRQVDQICQNIWGAGPTEGGLAGDLWVEAALPPKSSGQKMSDCVQSGHISRKLATLLDKNGAFGIDWDLREIQAKSLEVARNYHDKKDKPAIVVSAGTGAGKTESFLLPMLDELMRSPRTPGQGVSAIILYPMNALVTDQVDRLTKWLQGQNKLRIFHFTGSTPEDHGKANHSNYPKVDQCSFRTRQEARGLEDKKGKAVSPAERQDQPDIIITNYSMLEYMLCRPQDAVFFGENLRHIVLDEAHLYTGNLAAEITLLLRRVCSKSGASSNAITHYATSATLVEGAIQEQKEALRRFGSKVFSKSAEQVSVILGGKADPLVSAPSHTPPLSSPANKIPWPTFGGVEEVNKQEAFVQATDDEWKQWMDALSELLPKLNIDWPDQPKEISPFLRSKLSSQPAFQHLYHLLYHNRIQSLERLSKELWGSEGEKEKEATRRLLQAGAIARTECSRSPLLPNRIHWSIRAPSGLFFSFAHEHAPREEQIYRIKGKPIGYFYSPGYFSRPEEDTTHPLLVMRDSSRGRWLLAGIETSSRLTVGSEALPKTKKKLEALLERLSFFTLSEISEGDGIKLSFDPQTGQVGAPSEVSLTKVEHSEQELQTIKPLGSDSRLQLSIIAEETLVEMPSYPGDSKLFKPAEGKRLLIFSDSRKEAATLGPSLTNNHERQLFRALVAEGLTAVDDIDITSKKTQISTLENLLPTLPDVARKPIEDQIAMLEEQAAAAENGLLPSEFIKHLKSAKRAKEFFVRVIGEQNRSDTWSQQAFEKNTAKMREELPTRLSQELARKTLWPDLNLESAGLLELVYPKLDELEPSAEFLGSLPNTSARKLISKSFSDFTAEVLDHIRDLGAVTLGSHELDSEYGIGGGYIGKWLSEDSRYKYALLPLITTKEDSLIGNYTRLYLRTAGLTEEQSQESWKKLIEQLFAQLYQLKQNGKITWIEFNQRQAEENRTAMALQIKFNELRIRKPLQLFQCQDTGQVLTHNPLGCHLRNSRPSIEELSKENLTKNPRIARVHKEWRDSETFKYGLWAEEHSAQIGAEENRRLQDLFKAGIRNVLSSTTTLELGIDIGGLNGVLMGNIPPGKASYLQRAGRAGRRADGSSLVVSYSRNTPYERKVFEDFSGYLETPLREPSVFLDRSDLVRRHVHALLMGDFFHQAYGAGTKRGAMDAFGKMGVFTNAQQTSYWQPNDPQPPTSQSDASSDLAGDFSHNAQGDSLADFFENYLDSLGQKMPNEFAVKIESLTEGTPLPAQSKDEKSLLITTLRKKVQSRIDQWRKDYESILGRWKSIPRNATQAERNLANALHYQLKQLYGATLIETFSDSMILPRYGFPIGLSELKVNQGKASRSGSTYSDPYRLNRSASQALREYAPGSKLLVGAKIVHSQGILKSWTGDDIANDGMGLRAWFRWNEKSGDFEYKYNQNDGEDDFQLTNYSKKGALLFVKHGFSTAACKFPTYGGSQKQAGTVANICRPPEDPEMIHKQDCFAGISGTSASLNIGGQLLALNSGDYEQGFVVCTKCGFSRSEVAKPSLGPLTGREKLPSNFAWHTSIHESDDRKTCWKKDETFVLRNINLSARQICDYLKVSLPNPLHSSTDRRFIANTIAQSLRISGAALLNVDCRELMFLPPTFGKHTDITICDSLAGGSGHVRDLSKIDESWWKEACQQIFKGTLTQATLDLLTADVPTEGGLPAINIELTRGYLKRLNDGLLADLIAPEKDDDDIEIDFSNHLKRK